MAEPVSRKRRELTEILHIAPVRRGLVPATARGPGSAPITYADRLKTILEAFQRREDQEFPNVIRLFRGIHTAQWALIDGDTRLVLSVVFDGEWHDYLASLTHEVPGFLHLIWSNCEGWEPVANEPEKLFRFIKAYQVRVNFLFAHHPDLTVRDVEWLKALRKAVDEKQQLLTDVQDVLTKELAPRPPELLREQALQEYDGKNTREGDEVRALQRAKTAFERVIKPLYADGYFRQAFEESFGPTTQVT